MNWWQRTFGRKAAYFVPPNDEVTSVVLGYPNWPIFDSYGAMYRKQPAVRTVVDFLARNVAQLNPKIYLRVGDTDRREFNSHPVAQLLRNPNPTTTRFNHLRDTVADIAIYDRAYWRLERPRGGLVKGLTRIPPSRLLLEVDQKTLKTTYKFDGQVMTRRDMVIFHGYHPDGSEQGVSPLETLRRVLSEEWAATTYREWFWRNGSRHSGVIERSMDAPEWSNDARVRFREQWESSMAGGTNSGRTAILEDGMKWNPSAFSPKDSEYIEGRKLTYTEVARVYAPALVGLLSEDGKTAVESFHRQLYQDVLAPVLRMLQDEIDSQLLTLDEFNYDPDAYCEFNLAEKLKGSFEEQGRTLVTSVGVPYMTVNEGRARLNLPRIDDAALDMPVQPLNVLYGGQPSVVVPTSDPGRAAREFAAKLRAFFDRQEAAICSRLGGLKDQGEESILVAWGKEDRWNQELAKLYRPSADADVVAAEINGLHRQKSALAFADGGLPAVRQVFEDAKDSVFDLAALRVSQMPALIA